VHARHDKTIAMRDHWNIKSGDHTHLLLKRRIIRQFDQITPWLYGYFVPLSAIS
jgi:hypothetical protein